MIWRRKDASYLGVREDLEKMGRKLALVLEKVRHAVDPKYLPK